jgi:hypothetical protein
MEVRREDQEKINKFSTLHQKELRLEDELKAKQVSLLSQRICRAMELRLLRTPSRGYCSDLATASIERERRPRRDINGIGACG